jgi:chemotaxis protein methyltransferase CheR
MPGAGEQLSKDLTLAEFRQFRDYIHQHSGIYLEESKLDSLRISLLARATRLDCEGWDAYFEVLARDEPEFRELMSLITINETSFFRFPAQFEALRGQVLPQLAASRGGDNRTVRIWSAGCSTGEQPYSIAMTFLESGLEGSGWRCEVMGTDVSTKALGVAKAALYPERAVAGLPPDIVRRYFTKEDDGYRVASSVRSLVDFGYHNLIKEPYPLALMGNWDVIFCRNVTIYFKLESTKRVVHNFYSSLNQGGYLFPGHSETLTSVSDAFEPVETSGVFLYRKSPPGPAPVARPDASRQPASRPGRAATPAGRPDARPSPSAARVTPDPLVAARRSIAAGRPAEALAQTAEALASDRNDADAHLVAAHAYADVGDYDHALAECDKVLAINPLMPGARYLLGVIHHRQGDSTGAVSELKKTVYIDPDFALAHMSLGNIYKAQGRFADACREYENALRALYANPEGDWTQYLGGWKADVVLRTCERSLLECRKATGTA